MAIEARGRGESVPGEIVATGDELTTGAIADTNGALAASRLREVGVAMRRFVVVGDDPDDIENAVRDAAGRARYVLVSGGLGPTADDLTTAAVARAAGVELAPSEAALAHVRAVFARRGLPMSPNNEKQANLPRGAEIVPNPVGTAVGFAVTIGGARVYCLPGVPVEYRRMLEDEIVPRIGAETGNRLSMRVLKVYGTGESRLETELAGLPLPPGLRLGYRAVFPEVHLRLYGGATTALAGFDEAERLVRDRVGTRLFATGDETMAGAVGRLLLAARATLTVAESCTGGLLAGALTAQPGASEWIDRGFVTYTERAKIELLGVPVELTAQRGVVSDEVARAMAEGARRVASTDVAVSITGYAGPTGGTPAVPVGTVFIAVATGRGVESKRYAFPGDRDRIRLAAVWAAMDLVRRTLLRE